MHFEIKDTELELIEKTALEEDISLDGALKKLLFLGRDTKQDTVKNAQIRTEALEGVLTRLGTLSIFTEELYAEIKTATSEVREIL